MNKIIKKNIVFISLILCIGIMLLYSPIYAQEYNLKGAQGFMQTVGSGIGYETDEEVSNIDIVIGNIIKIVLSFLGIIFLILMIVGGYQWMTAGGNEETIAKAKKRIINATIGVAIVLMAYVIVDQILYYLMEGTGMGYME